MFDLYKDLIIDHGINPRNKYVMTNFTNMASGFNHFCGDKFDIYLHVVENSIINVSFYGTGCSVSTASASLLTMHIKDKSIFHAKDLTVYFINIIKDINHVCNEAVYTDLNVLASVRKYPVRVKCATLIWHTLIDAIKIDSEKI